MDQNTVYKSRIDAILPVLQAARVYHRHDVIGMDSIPRTGRTLVVVSHSLATYDILLLMTAMYMERARLPRPLIDRLFFKVPYLGDVAKLFGAEQGSPQSAKDLLESEEIVTVAPGGMREALRPSTQRYQIRWDKRFGFAKLAMATKSPIVLAACPKADDLYDVYPSHVTAWAYRTFKVPLFLARGLGPTPLPRPVKLVHYLSEPIPPPELPEDPEAQKLAVQNFHRVLVNRMHELISNAIQKA